MNHRLFPTTVSGSLCFITVYDDVYQGLLHCIIRHYWQLQKAIPPLEEVLKRLPYVLRDHFSDASFGGPQKRTDALKAVATYLADSKATGVRQTLKEAQELVADYFDITVTESRWQKRTITSGEKIQQRFDAELDGVPTTLVLDTTQIESENPKNKNHHITQAKSLK